MENASYILTQAFYIFYKSDHAPFHFFFFFCSKLKIAVFMCQKWQLAVNILAHAIKWSWAVGHAHCVQAGEDTSFWKHKRRNCKTFLSLLPIPICMPCIVPLHTVKIWRNLPVEVSIVRGQSYPVHIMAIQRQQKKTKYPAEIHSTPSVRASILSNQWCFCVCKVYAAIKPRRPELTVEN